jgi:hypothetical protein
MRAWLTSVLVAFFVIFIAGTSNAFIPLLDGLVPSSEGLFISNCAYSHRLPDDPIVRPGQPGASHSHDFLANKTTNAFSTYESLRAGATTCQRSGDTAAYWVPTLYNAGVAVRPSALGAYYTARGKNALNIKPFPAGLRIVAGNASATGPQPTMVAEWSCGDGTAASSSVPLCVLGELRLHVRFPDCWDGVHLDSSDHRSHMAYSLDGHCPAGYRSEMPGLQINIAYPVQGGPTISLSSGSPNTAHADFFNAWDQAQLGALVRNCLNLSRNCGTGS